jgi:osmotically-inducible protein OsmY
MTHRGMSRQNSLPHTIAKAVLCVGLVASLQGCVGVLAGSAVGAALATADRRTLGAQTDDKAIGLKAELSVPKITGSDGHVNVNSYNRKVLLTGEVKDAAMKEAVEREVRAVDGVISVVNELEIAPPTSYTARSNDAIITGRVKSGLVEMKTISATSFKVVTERSVVYLLGRVTQREAALAADIARGTSGVQKVVKIFEYITEDELKNLAPAAGSSTVHL